MLIEFRVENHRSIRDEQVLSMEAGRVGDDADPRPRTVKGHAEKLLPVAALYGANASVLVHRKLERGLRWPEYSHATDSLRMITMPETWSCLPYEELSAALIVTPFAHDCYGPLTRRIGRLTMTFSHSTVRRFSAPRLLECLPCDASL